jgi:hypothetical protein
MDETQARTWLSEPRYGRFLDACGGSHRHAVALYEWHAELSAASFGLIHHFEVLIRNAIDGTLGGNQPQAPIEDTWLLDFEILRPDGIKQVITAIERLEKGKMVTRGRIVAGLSFAFWAGLFGRRYEELWRHSLRSVFPGGAVTRKTLSTRMRLIQRFRNRVAHHDSLLGQDVSARLEDMLTIAVWIDPAARSWLVRQTNALAIARQMPPSTCLGLNPRRRWRGDLDPPSRRGSRR